MGRNRGEDRAPPDDARGNRAGDPGSVAPRAATGDSAPLLCSVRVASDADAAVAATLHASQISDGFLSFLGPRFLERLYRRINRVPGSFLLIAVHEGGAQGFIAGSVDVTSLYKSFVVRDGVAASLQSAGRLISGWRQALQTLGHGTSGPSTVGRGAELLAVAVDPAWQGHGVGRLLVASFLDEVVARGLDAAHVVVGEENATAVALYRQAAFVPVDRFELHPGTVSLVMQWYSSGPGPV
jgi:ribosomal protein S18 acetylase RimI-like enzyme